MTDVLVLPGYGDSGPGHWQSMWEAADPRLRRVQQHDWLEPRLDDWLTVLDGAVAACAAPPFLVAHSLGCALVAHWVARGGARAQGALMVAPVDVDALVDTLDAVQTFAPVPLVRLPFASTVVIGDNDPYVATARAEAFAHAWGSRLVVVPRGGHLNTESGFGPWPEGFALLDELIRG